jgi:AcrR family transcriptional regulator
MTARAQGRADPLKPRGRPRSQASERAILDATLELLSELGYGAVTVDAIAARAGASKSTIYRRWPSKENLVIAAFARSPLLVAPKRGTVEARLTEVILQFATFMQQTPLGGVLPALVVERAHNPGLDAALMPLVHQRRQAAIDVLREGVSRGELPASIDFDTAVDLLTGPVLQRIMVMGQPAGRRFVSGVVKVVCAGLRAVKGG